MAKYLANNSGQLTEVTGTSASTGVGDAGKIVQLDGSGKLDTTLMPVGIGAQTKLCVASENLAAGDLVNLWNNSGVVNARKADASNNRRAMGFVTSPVTATNNATVYLDGTITGLTSLTPGAIYYLSASTAGGVVSTAPSVAAQISQEIGPAISATEIDFEPRQPITLA